MPSPPPSTALDADLALLEERLRVRRVVPFVGAGVSLDFHDDWLAVLGAIQRRTSIREEDFKRLLRDRGPAVAAEVLRLALEADQSLVDVAESAMQGRRKPAAPRQGYSPLHALFANGPWPGLVTTNWDDCLERAAESSPVAQRCGRLPVKTRREAASFYAELRAAHPPPPLLKLHGGFDGESRAEFVLGHADYRRVMTRELDVRAVMGHLAAEYSLLFYGTSLLDPDALSWLDEAHESLGPAIGPHFWLTADPTSPAVAPFLRETYGIRLCAFGSWAETERTLEGLLERARAPALAEGRWSGRVGRVQVALVRRELTADEWGGARAVGLSVGVETDGRVVPTGRAVRVLAPEVAAAPLPNQARAGEARPAGSSGKWLVCGQERGEFGRTRLVRRATLSFLEGAARSGATELWMTLIAGGGGRLPPQDALGAQLHAIGDFARDCARELSVAIALPAPPRGAADLLGDVLEGRLPAAAILSRGARDLLQFTAVYRTRDAFGPGRLVALPVVLPADGTAGDLARAIVAPAPFERLIRFEDGPQVASYRPDLLLLEAGVTDGAVVRLA